MWFWCDYVVTIRWYANLPRGGLATRKVCCMQGFSLRFRFGDHKEILRDRLEEFERPFSIDVISGHYILWDRWRNLRDRFGPSKHLKKNTGCRCNGADLPASWAGGNAWTGGGSRIFVFVVRCVEHVWLWHTLVRSEVIANLMLCL